MKTALEASKTRTPDELAVRSASLRNLAVTMTADPDTLHNAADMLYDASRELEVLREQVGQLTAQAQRDLTAVTGMAIDLGRFKGALKPFAALHIATCDSCDGTGFRRGDKSCKDACHICGGTGELVSAVLPEDVRKAQSALETL